MSTNITVHTSDGNDLVFENASVEYVQTINVLDTNGIIIQTEYVQTINVLDTNGIIIQTFSQGEAISIMLSETED